jgi:hypothetical protein
VPRTRLRRLGKLQVDDRAALDELLDAALVGHVGVVVDGEPVVVPTAVARDGDRVPEPAPDLAFGIPVPPSVRRLVRHRALSAPGG